MALIPDFLTKAILNKFGCSTVNTVSLSGGFSGTTIVKMEIGGDTWVARAWPGTAYNAKRINDWAEVASFLERSLADLIPRFNKSPIISPEPWGKSRLGNQTLMIGDSHLWTLSKWVFGEPLKSSNVNHELLCKYVLQLARLHRVVRRMRITHGISLGLRERQESLRFLEKDCLEIARTCSTHPLGADLAQFLASVHTKLSVWTEQMNRLASRSWDLHWIVRDLWRDNLLVDAQNRWIYTVDVGASRCDWPVFDFVRLVGSLLVSIETEKQSNIWEELVDVYRRENPLDDFPKAHEIKLIHEASTAISIGFWFKRLTQEHIAPSLHSKGMGRLDELLRTFLLQEGSTSPKNLSQFP